MADGTPDTPPDHLPEKGQKAAGTPSASKPANAGASSKSASSRTSGTGRSNGSRTTAPKSNGGAPTSTRTARQTRRTTARAGAGTTAAAAAATVETEESRAQTAAPPEVAAPQVAAPEMPARAAPAPAAPATTDVMVGLARVRPKRELRRRRIAWAVAGLAALGVVVAGVVHSTKSTTATSLTPLATQTVLRLPATSVVTAVAEADGAGYATDAQRDVLIRFDPATGRVEGTVTLPGLPSAMVVHGADVWVADSTHNAVVKVNATTLQVGGSASLPDTPTSLSVLGNTLWVTTNAVDRITPVSLITGFVGQPVYVLSGAVRATPGFGAVWATGTVNRLTRIVPSTKPGAAPQQRAIEVGQGPTAVAAGVDAVWVANTKSDTVSRVDPSTLAVTATYKVGHAPDSVAVAPDGRVLIGYSGGTVVDVLGIQSKTETLPVGTHPQTLVPVPSAVWVAGATPGQVVSAG